MRDHCDNTFVNLYLNLKLSFVVDLMESVESAVRDMLLVSLCGYPLLALAVPKTATSSSLDSINIRGNVKKLFIPTTYLLVFLLGIYSMIMSVISMTSLPYSFEFPNLTDRINL